MSIIGHHGVLLARGTPPMPPLPPWVPPGTDNLTYNATNMGGMWGPWQVFSITQQTDNLLNPQIELDPPAITWDAKNGTSNGVFSVEFEREYLGPGSLPAGNYIAGRRWSGTAGSVGLRYAGSFSKRETLGGEDQKTFYFGTNSNFIPPFEYNLTSETFPGGPGGWVANNALRLQLVLSTPTFSASTVGACRAELTFFGMLF